MHLFWLVLFGLIAIFWMTYGLKVAYGAVRLAWLKDCAPAAEADCPRISVLFAARDEEESCRRRWRRWWRWIIRTSKLWRWMIDRPMRRGGFWMSLRRFIH